MRSLLNLADKVAVVTGGGSGIGRAVARSLADRGCHVALADVDEVGMEETARLVGNHVRVTRHPLDVANSEAVAAFPNVVTAAHGGVDILVNNAGVAVGGTFEQIPEEDFDWLLSINLMGVVRMTRAFLPVLKLRPEAQLVNVSSILGIIAPPKSTAYALSKFGVRGFSESLRHELNAENSGVGVSVVHPGGIRTAIVDSARVSTGIGDLESAAERRRQQAVLKMTPEQAGEVIVAGIEKRRPRILVGSDAKLIAIIERLAPLSYWSLLGRYMK